IREQNKRTQFALQAEEDKVNHLNKLKAKLESTLDEMEENLAREQKIRGDVEKSKAKLEVLKFEDEQGLVAQFNEKLKELQSRIQELEERLEAERAARSKAEKSRQQLGSELEEVVDRLEEQDGATAAQSDLTKKREAELMLKKRDKERRRLEMEKEELQAALEEAESALEQEEAKVQRAQLEMSQIRQEIDRRLAEKDE
uniref:Myosin, sarcomeric (Fragments) n=1 Tax=Schistosoma mansoni TaxID=6183 RepID=Q7M4G5_SCHMA